MTTTPAPTWSITDIVYLLASAKIGHLEAYQITGVTRIRGKWLYTIDVAQRLPSEATVMDMVDLKNPRTMYFDERELIGMEEAFLLVRAALTRKLNKINELIDKHFPNGSES